MRLRKKAAEAPSIVYLEAYDEDGELVRRIDCLIEQTGPREWQATPVTNVSPHEGLKAYIDCLPGGHTVNFIFHGEFEVGTYEEIVAGEEISMTSDAQRDKFVELYHSDPGFHHAVDVILAGEVSDLRVALTQIGGLRRENFQTGFDYELAVRTIADRALERLEKLPEVPA